MVPNKVTTAVAFLIFKRIGPFLANNCGKNM